MQVTASFLQINVHTKLTLRITLHTIFQYSSILNVWYIDYHIINSIASKQNIVICMIVQNAYTPTLFANDKHY